MPPEASSRSVQTIMLGLGALLLGIAAVVFVGVAITGLEPWAQLVILLGVSAAFLLIAPAVATRGLGATAETLSAVGLVLFSVAGYPLWSMGVATALPNPVYIGLVAATTAAVGYGHHRATQLTVPCWAALIALQPVVPLVLAPQITGPAGWATAFALVAAHNAGLAVGSGPRKLGLLAWVLHAAALALAIGYATGSLFLAGSVAGGLPGALTLLLAGMVALAGGVGTRVPALAHLGAGLLTLALIVSSARLVALALPGRALLPTAAIMAGVAVAALALPPAARRGPQRATAVALTALGVVLAGLSLRAGYAAVIWPPWPAELTGYATRLAEAAGPAGWQLAATGAAATVGAGTALPAAFRREVAVVGAALTALAAPASLGMAPEVGAWVMMLVAAGLGLSGLSATTMRAAVSHIAAAGALGLAAAGTALAAPVLTATVLMAITVTGVVVAGARPHSAPAELVATWAAGGATVAFPGAAATGAAAAGLETPGVLAAAFAALCVSLGYATVTQLRDRLVPLPVWAGAGISTLVVVGAALLTDPHPADSALAVLLLVTAVLVGAGPRLDAVRRPYRMLDSADIAAAAVTVSVVATLARVAALVLPFTGADAALTTAAVLVLGVTLSIRVLPESWRRGPAFGVALLCALVGGVAGAAAAVGGFRALMLAGPLWEADLARWAPEATIGGLTWSASLALVLLAVAAAAVLPHPVRHHASAALMVLAALGAPAGVGAPWWAPAVVTTAAATGYAVAAVARMPAGGGGPGPSALDAGQAAGPRAVAAVALSAYAVSASLSRPWLTAAVLTAIAATGLVTAALALESHRTDPRLRVGSIAVAGVLLAVPGALTSLAVHFGYGLQVGLPAALAGASLGLALVAALHIALPPVAARPGEPPLAPYLPYATVGISVSATAVAFATLGTGLPTAVYAAAAVLLAVLAELVRAADPTSLQARAGRLPPDSAPPPPRHPVSPPVGALLAAATPAAIALVAIAPALRAALLDPYQTLAGVWQGPPEQLLATAAVPATSVLAALLLTLAAALAAVGFGGAVASQGVPLTAPGLAVTLLITPAALNAPWPSGTLAALVVFVIAMLGVALTPPPLPDRTVRPLRVARMLVLAVGLAAGSAGLAGSLASVELTWATFGGAVAVGVTAALGGHTRAARLLGWLFAAVTAQVFALVTAHLLGVGRAQAWLFLLAVSAVALLLVARLPRLRPPREPRELAAVELLGGYAPLLVALGLAYVSPLDLAALLIGAGAVLGLAAVRSGRSYRQRRALWWLAAASEVGACWLVLVLFDVGLLEAYTLPFAALALAVGALENRFRPDLGSWVTYGPGLAAALAPSLLLVVTTTSPDLGRQLWVILGGVATLLLGSRLGQRAPLIIGSVVTAVAALHLLSLAGPWLILVPIGVLLLALGAGREKRQRDLERLRGAYSRMR